MEKNKLAVDEEKTAPLFLASCVACGFIILAIWAFSSGTSPQSSSTHSAPITTLYTTTTANVRACAASTCDIVGTYAPSTSVDITNPANGTITDISELPDWITFSYTASDGSSATGYVSKTVLSDQQTQQPGPSGSAAASVSSGATSQVQNSTAKQTTVSQPESSSPTTQQTSVSSSQVQIEAASTATENASKQNALNVYNQILSEYTSLDTYLSSAINVMHTVDAQFPYVTTTTMGQLRASDLQNFMTAESNARQIVNTVQSRIEQLESEPLSYFLTYQIANDPAQPYDPLNNYPKIEELWVNNYNDYLQYLAILRQASTPISVPAISRPTTCSVQSPGLAGGSGSIECYGATKTTVCSFQSPGIGGGQGNITCY